MSVIPNFEKDSIYVHHGLYLESQEGPSNITLTTHQIMHGLYVITSNGGSMTTPTAQEICDSIPDNVKNDNVFFAFTIANIATTNVTLIPGSGITPHPTGNILLHKDKCYQIMFRITDIGSQAVHIFQLGYT